MSRTRRFFAKTVHATLILPMVPFYLMHLVGQAIDNFAGWAVTLAWGRRLIELGERVERWGNRP